jgi:hypothetical protein
VKLTQKVSKGRTDRFAKTNVAAPNSIGACGNASFSLAFTLQPGS